MQPQNPLKMKAYKDAARFMAYNNTFTMVDSYIKFLGVRDSTQLGKF